MVSEGYNLTNKKQPYKKAACTLLVKIAVIISYRQYGYKSMTSYYQSRQECISAYIF